MQLFSAANPLTGIAQNSQKDGDLSRSCVAPTSDEAASQRKSSRGYTDSLRSELGNLQFQPLMICPCSNARMESVTVHFLPTPPHTTHRKATQQSCRKFPVEPQKQNELRTFVNKLSVNSANLLVFVFPIVQ